MRRLVFFVFLLFFLFPVNAYASNFITDYTVNYSIGNNANTHVRFEVTLTNSTEQYYASSYSILLGFTDVRNVTAADSDGNITPVVTKSSKGQNVKLDFNKKATGLGSKLTFNLSFDTNEVAENVGNIWEINIPGLSNQSDFSSFNVNVIYPTSIGKPASIKPDNSNLINRISGNKISFTKGDLGTSGISIAFGDYQIYDFNLTYHLENNNIFPIATEMALPPQTNYQDVSIKDINPRPKNVKMDKDGNWLALYELKPAQEIKVVVTGSAKVNLSPRTEIISESQLLEYTRPQKYWESNNLKIKALANELKTPSAIYQYIVDNLTYDFSRVTDNKPRLGALGILDNQASAVCMEFTDLFIALARSAGIPAREIDGFANTKNTQQRPLSLVKDILHAWPEYYDRERQAWIMVDPTWGNTTNGIDYFSTLDFDHLTFVIKGQDSSYPVPAGGYKTSADLSTKDVDVKLSTDFSGNYALLTNLFFPEKSLPGFPVTGKIKIVNNGSIISEPQDLKINSTFLQSNQREIKVSQIPPYGYLEIPITFAKTPILTNKSDVITIQVGKNSYQQKILISPFIANRIYIGGIIFVVLVSVTTVVLVRSRRLPFLRRQG